MTKAIVPQIVEKDEKKQKEKHEYKHYSDVPSTLFDSDGNPVYVYKFFEQAKAEMSIHLGGRMAEHVLGQAMAFSDAHAGIGFTDTYLEKALRLRRSGKGCVLDHDMGRGF